MGVTRTIWRRLRRILPLIGEAAAAPSIKQTLIEQEIRVLKSEMRLRTPGNPALHGFKVYSQMDEDGIIEHIFEVIGEGYRTFIEIGCGNGTENNTHYLALKGWRGVWVDGSKENIDHIEQQLPRDAPALLVQRLFVTRENADAAMTVWQERLGESVDLLSLDIDGDDAAVLERILSVSRPRVLVVEYNGKFPPPIKLSVASDPNHSWGRDDYYGSSLQVFVDQLANQYRLVACGLSGANAYFVRHDCATSLPHYSTNELYMAPRHYLVQRQGGAYASLRFLKDRLTIS
jgi:hypothetical protein